MEEPEKNPLDFLKGLEEFRKLSQKAFAQKPVSIARDEVNGVIVSTVITNDRGPETAIIDRAGTHPVERYDTEDDAIKGHKKWVKEAETITDVIKLGYTSLVPSTLIHLSRFSKVVRAKATVIKLKTDDGLVEFDDTKVKIGDIKTVALNTRRVEDGFNTIYNKPWTMEVINTIDDGDCGWIPTELLKIEDGKV